jgi:hypothetical protein
MAVLTESDMREAIVITEIGEIPFAEIIFKTGTTVSAQDTVTIDDEYTAGSATATEEIFAGLIEEKDYIDEINSWAESKAIELEQLRPSGSYHETYQAIMLYLINSLCSSVDVSDSWGLYVMGDDNFNDETAGTTGTNIGFIDSVAGGASAEIIAGPVGTYHNYCLRVDFNTGQYCSHTIANKTSGTIEYFHNNVAGNGFMGVYLYGDGGLAMQVTDNDVSTTKLIGISGAGTADLLDPYTPETWVHVRIDYECGAGAYKGLAADTHTIYINGVAVLEDAAFRNAQTHINEFRMNSAGALVHFDAVNFSWDSGGISIGENLYCEGLVDYIRLGEYDAVDMVFQGDKTLSNLLKAHADETYTGWYLGNDLKLYCNSLDTDSGFDLALASECYNVDGRKQIKEFDKVILIGGIVNGEMLTSTSGVGDIIYKDTYAHIVDQDILDGIAAQLATREALEPVEVELTFVDATTGMLQVGETVSVAADIPFDDSSTLIPAGQYIITRSEFNILTKESKLWLSDGIVFHKRTRLDEENSQYIGQILKEDEVYSSAWDGDLMPPSKNQVYNILNNFIHLRDQKAQNTAGGTFTAGAWRTRDLTTEVTDQPSACSLAANQFTLDAGTYIIMASAPAYYVNQHQTRLYNITDSALEIAGTSEYMQNSAGAGSNRSFIVGLFTITALKSFEIQHYCATTAAGDGFGVKNNLQVEVYTEVMLWKVG